MTHSRKLYEALQTEKCSIEEENSELLNTNTVLKEEQRTMELELVVAKKDVSCRKKITFHFRLNLPLRGGGGGGGPMAKWRI